MNSHLGRSIAWVAVFTTACMIALFGLIAVFDDLRFDPRTEYRALFTNVSGLASGNFVRIAGVETGKVDDVILHDDGTVEVVFAVDKGIPLTLGTRAEVKYQNLIGDRFLALQMGPGPTGILQPGGQIPLSQTAPALNIDALIGGFRPLFRALDPDQVNALSNELLSVFQGQGGTVTSVLGQLSTLTATLADHGQLIGDVIGNLNTVLGSLDTNKDQLSDGIDKLAQLVHGLSERSTDISNGLAYISAGTGSIADLLSQARDPIKQTVLQTDRTSGQVLSDRDYVDNLIKTLPESYQMLTRQGIYGDFFNFYLCDAFLKVNGKDQNPIYIKLAGQSSGRCTPK
jgi:phospholipid/cholesterol/gamma-HCH transport system substrate-binding protein